MAGSLRYKHSQTSEDAVKAPSRGPRGRQVDPKSTPKILQELPLKPSRTIEKPFAFEGCPKTQPLLFVLCSMLITNGHRIAFRSLQEGPRTPQDARRPPTWSQHGIQEKRQDRSKGSKNLVPRGSQARIAAGFQNGPRMDPKLTPIGPRMDVLS